MIAGYGSATYRGAAEGTYTNNFSASVSPVLLYRKGPDFLFEAELEFEREGTETESELEYAQLDYLGFEDAQIVVGKFLLPFGVFGERLHPTWINKLPTTPVVFGHAHEGVPEEVLLPILSDAGVMVRWRRSVASTWAFDFSGFVTQGPTLAEEEPGAEEPIAPPVAFGVSFPDSNKNKMFGGRVGMVRGGSLEFYGSGMHATYDEDGDLDFYAGALSAEWRHQGLELRAEVVRTWQQFQGVTDLDTLVRSGQYVQASYRSGAWEPVARWGRLNDSDVDAGTVEEGRNDLALGVVFWFDPSLPLKAAWEFKEDRTDAFSVQWAFGF